MIDFACGRCGKAYTLAPEFAGRRGKCKACGADVVVPDAPVGSMTAKAPARPAHKPPMRTRRLLADAAQMARAFADSPLIRVRAASGDPPEVYQVEYRVKGLDRAPGAKEPIAREHHLVELQLTADYPRLGPKCRMLTPIFHPNIDPATICVGDHWAAGERLADLVVRIGEMIAYQAYNIKSPLNAEAAMWADLNMLRLPIDARSVRPPGMGMGEKDEG
ncbi:MAG: ubiquitin-conjugating enzyme E2 [Tepidisphaeraceae bacterium]